ncbi:hypothetical protein HanPSC8_Chr07g0304521 [Helianthus annuus]|nr:hypothetical protein HanPSC8_Chr07g0304521 [Helianthus annuus]
MVKELMLCSILWEKTPFRVLHMLERLADAAQRSTSMTRPDPPLQNTSYARYSRMLWLILVLLLLMATRFIARR